MFWGRSFCCSQQEAQWGCLGPQSWLAWSPVSFSLWSSDWAERAGAGPVSPYWLLSHFLVVFVHLGMLFVRNEETVLNFLFRIILGSQEVGSIA